MKILLAMIEPLIVGIIALVIGLGLRYWINRRKFYRRSMTGSEGFSSFERSVIMTFLERIGKWVAYILIILGLWFILIYATQKDKGKDLEKKQYKPQTALS
jgi:preprotein translocase subunit SecG